MPKPLYLVLAVCIIVIGWFGFTASPTFTQKFRQFSANTLSPVWKTTGWIKNKIVLTQQSLRTIDLLDKEVRELRAEHTKLATENIQLRKLEAENIRLREMLGFKKTSPMRLLACRVAQRDPSNWWSSVIIDRGSKDDSSLAPDQPVISARGVVGKTAEVGPTTTRVILLVDENCKISAEVEGSGARGITIGASPANNSDPFCRITYVSRETTMPLGASVFTSGLGGNFPQGLLIGAIKEAHPLTSERNFGLFRDGILEPAVDLDDLREVFIILRDKEGSSKK
ncbi:MAG: rod shape-determining protein MreC [bacterium]